MTTSNFRVNIISSRITKIIVRNILFPYGFQLLALIVFIVLVIVGFRTGTAESYGTNLTPIIRKTNLATLVVWGLWWPGLILTTILLGRVWCTVCPMEFVSNIANRIAGWLGIKGMVLSVWLRRSYLVLLSYVILQLLVAGFQVHRTPLYTAFVLLALLSLALLAGLLFREPRAFCNSFCPAAILLDTYGSLSPFTLTKNKDDVCAQCETKDCIKSGNRDKIDARSCPSYLRPFDLKKNDPCVICFQCAKICPHDNIGFGIVRPTLQQRISDNVPITSVLFIFIASGFVSHELFAETPTLDDIFHAAPKWFATRLGIPGIFPWFEALWFLLILPTIILSLVWVASLLSKSRRSFAELCVRIAFYFVPVLAVGHAIKALVKMNSWSVYLPSALSDPLGIRSAKSILNGDLQGLQPFVSEILIAVSASLLLLYAAVFAYRMIRRKLENTLHFPAYAGIGALVCLYSIVVLTLLMK